MMLMVALSCAGSVSELRFLVSAGIRAESIYRSFPTK